MVPDVLLAVVVALYTIVTVADIVASIRMQRKVSSRAGCGSWVLPPRPAALAGGRSGGMRGPATGQMHSRAVGGMAAGQQGMRRALPEPAQGPNRACNMLRYLRGRSVS